MLKSDNKIKQIPCISEESAKLVKKPVTLAEVGFSKDRLAKSIRDIDS